MIEIEYLLKTESFDILICEMLNYSTSEDRIELQNKYVDQILTSHFGKKMKWIKDENGKPFLKESDFHISVSHSQNKIGVMISKYNCGFDIQYLSHKVLRIQEKFLNKNELLFIQEEFALAMVTACWSAKESVYKYYGKKKLEFKTDMIIEEFFWEEKGEINCILLKNEKVKVAYLRKEDVIYTWTIPFS